MSNAVITIPIAPEFDVGPLTLSWHGVFVALGILVALALSVRFANERGLDVNRVVDLAMITVVAGIVGARALYLLEQGDLLRPAEWLGSNGFSFYGAVVVGGGAAVAYAWRIGQGLTYVDALAVGFGLGMAVGRIGDILIGEHFGEPSDLPWAIAYTDPDARVPSTDVAYHPGALYEALVGLAIFAAIWPRRHRYRHPGTMLAAVVGLYALGRFVIFFWRADSEAAIAGLNVAQLISLALVAVSLAAVVALRRMPPRRPPAPAADSPP